MTFYCLGGGGDCQNPLQIFYKGKLEYPRLILKLTKHCRNPSLDFQIRVLKDPKFHTDQIVFTLEVQGNYLTTHFKLFSLHFCI